MFQNDKLTKLINREKQMRTKFRRFIDFFFCIALG